MDNQLKGMIYNSLISKKGKKLAILIDPGKQSDNTLIEIVRIANETKVDFIFVGGSLVSGYIDNVLKINNIKGTYYLNKDDISAINYFLEIESKIECPNCAKLVDSVYPVYCKQCTIEKESKK